MNSESTIGPNFFVVGAQKCGTTSIHEHLKKHPQVYVPNEKEPEFFSTDPSSGEILFGENRCRSMEQYLQLYEGGRGAIARGDFSTSYLWDKTAVQRLHAFCSSARIIIMLRDPVERAYSSYLMNVLRKYDPAPTFSEALRQDTARDKTSWFASWLYVEAGLYYEQVRRYLDAFGQEQVLVLPFEDLARDPLSLFSRIASHIGIDAGPLRSLELSKAHNTYRMPRWPRAHRIARYLGLRGKLLPFSVRSWLRQNPLFFNHKKPDLSANCRRMLQDIYGPDILKLEDLLERKLPDLRRSWI